MAFVTRCPHCGAIWRLPDIAIARTGNVKCSACLHDFDAMQDLLEMPAGFFPDEKSEDSPVKQVPLQAQNSDTNSPLLHVVPEAPVNIGSVPHIVPGQMKESATPSSVDTSRLLEPKKQSRHLGSFIAGLLLLIIAAISLLIFNQQVLSVAPQLQPIYSKICAYAPCTGFYERQIESFVVSKTQLNKIDSAGNHLLDMTVINGSPRAQAVPHLLIELLDAKDTVVMKHTLTPADYLENVDAVKSLPPNQNLPIRITLKTNVEPVRFVVKPFYP